MNQYLSAIGGGGLLGTASAMLLILNGRVLGVSGILGSLLGRSRIASNTTFVVGLLAGPLVFTGLAGRMPNVSVIQPWPVLVVGGLLVGIGARMGSGCTSGHGIVGMARLSRRSIAATLTFLVSGIAVATAMELLK